MAKLKVNSYDTYNQFVDWAQEELDKIDRGDLDISIKPLDFRDCIFGLYKFLIEEALLGNKPKSTLSIDNIKGIGKEISDKLESIYSSNGETNNRNKLHNAYRYYRLSNTLDVDLDTIINACNLIVSYPVENRIMLEKALKKSTYISQSRFGTQEMYFVIKHFLDKCLEFEPKTHRYLLTPQYIIADMLKTGYDLKELASQVQPLVGLKVIEDTIPNDMVIRSRVIELPYELYYNVVVSTIKHKVELDSLLADTSEKSDRAFVNLRNLSKCKAPFTSISLDYDTDEIVSLLKEVLNIKVVGDTSINTTPNLQLSDLYLQRYGDNVKASIYDYFLDKEKTKEVCSITTISSLETHVYRGVSEEEYENYIKSLRNYLCIKEVIIEDGFRGRGLFRQILNSIIEEAKKEGLSKIVLQPYPMSSKAESPKSMAVLQKDLVQKYSHIGFKVVVEGEVTENGTKLILMELSLEDKKVNNPKLFTSSIFT